MSEALSGGVATTETTGGDFATKKRQFFIKLAYNNLALLQVHRDHRQLSFDVVDEDTGRRRRWGDPTQHCLVEAAASEVLADMIGLSEEDKRVFFEAAFVHDACKRDEIEALKGVTDRKIVDRVYAQSKQSLLDAGIDPRAVELVDRVAHTSLPAFATMDDQGDLHFNTERTPLELAMHYLDDVTVRTQIAPFNERMDFLDARAASGQYAYNNDGKEVWGGRTFFAAQREIGHMVEAELAGMAGIADPTTLPNQIAQGLYERIMAA